MYHEQLKLFVITILLAQDNLPLLLAANGTRVLLTNFLDTSATDKAVSTTEQVKTISKHCRKQ